MSTDRETRAASPAAERPETEEGGFDALAVWRTVLKYWATALATALVISVSIAFYTLGQTKIYESTSTVQFDPNPPRPLGGKVEAVVEMGAGAVWDTREYYETQYQIVRSMTIATKVVKELGLHRNPAFLYNLPREAPAPKDVIVSEEIAAETLQGRLKVEPVKGSRLALLRLQDANPERAALILSSLVDTYVQHNIQVAIDATVDANAWLTNQLSTLKVDLEKSEMDLHDYKKNNDLLAAAFDDKSNMLREQMDQLNKMLTDAQARTKEVQARRDQIAKVKAEDPTDMPATELLQSELLRSLRTDYILSLIHI